MYRTGSSAYIINNNPDLVKDLTKYQLYHQQTQMNQTSLRPNQRPDAYQLKAVNERRIHLRLQQLFLRTLIFNVSDTLEPVLEFVGQTK